MAFGPAGSHCFEKNELVELVLTTEERCRARSSPTSANDPRAKLAALQAKRHASEQQRSALHQAETEALMLELKERGAGWLETTKAMAQLASRQTADRKRAAAQQAGGFENSAAITAALNDPDITAEDLEIGTPMVKLGDASIASPFTSKMPSIRASLDILRQGRCTLVTTLQMYMILALNCLISAYSLSVLYLDGIKYGDKQMTATGILMSISFIAISQANPLPVLSPVRPVHSIFHPAHFCSLMGQFAVHLIVMMYAVSLAKAAMPPDYRSHINLDQMAKFEPSILNTVVFYISTVQQCCVFAVNYKGRPFMDGLTENTALLYSLGFLLVFALVCATETFPQFNTYLQLGPLPVSR
jgi:cation-transporting ATPase 13A1